MFNQITLTRHGDGSVTVTYDDDDPVEVDPDDPVLCPLVVSVAFIVAAILESDTEVRY